MDFFRFYETWLRSLLFSVVTVGLCSFSGACGVSTYTSNSEDASGESFGQTSESSLPDSLKIERFKSIDELRKLIIVKKVEGDGTEAKIVLPAGFLKVSRTVESSFRFRTHLWLYGQGLELLDRVRLEAVDRQNCGKERMKPCTLYAKDGVLLGPMQTEGKWKKRRLQLSSQIFAGAFFLIGVVSGQSLVLAQVFLLQGERGPAGEKGAEGPTGKGCSLQSRVEPNGSVQLSFTCGEQKIPITIPKGKDGEGCSLKSSLDQQGNSVLSFKCGSNPDVSVTIPKPKDGAEGKPGASGKDGNSCAVTKVGNDVSFKCNSAVKAPTVVTVPSLTANQKAYITSLQKNVRLTGAGVEIGSDAKSPVLLMSKDRVTVRNANLHIESGAGKTDATINGLGNLIIGYNENLTNPPRKVDRTGSHNLIVGVSHSYTGYGGVAFGHSHFLSGSFCSILGGAGNKASKDANVVVSGNGNESSGGKSVVVGGIGNVASGLFSSVVGGVSNKASAYSSIVLNGRESEASGDYCTVIGGYQTKATKKYDVLKGVAGP